MKKNQKKNKRIKNLRSPFAFKIGQIGWIIIKFEKSKPEENQILKSVKISYRTYGQEIKDNAKNEKNI